MCALYNPTLTRSTPQEWCTQFKLCFDLLSFVNGLFHHCLQDYLTDTLHDDVIKRKHFPRNWPFVRGIHRSPVNFPHKGQWRGALMFSLIYVWINDWVNTREAGDLRRQHGHYDVIVMGYLMIAFKQSYDCPNVVTLKNMGKLSPWLHQ